MDEEKNNTTYQATEYVATPQNDFKQIEQIAREYESEPAKGIAHGLQKDAIQNGIGARLLIGNEPNSYRNWSFKFKLFKINGVFALSFTDEGTKGLTGDILNIEQIDNLSAEGKLTPNQNLSRFLTRFESGGNLGPGTFGRGKLLFQAASESSTIICDSLRYDDGKYIAFERKLKGNRLMQSAIPYEAEAAKQFLKKICAGNLSPLEKPGTRITIIDLNEEVVDAIKNSFVEDKPAIMEDYSLSFVKMIEETWWEIIHKFNAKILVEYDGKIKQIQLTEPLKSIATHQNSDGWKVYKKNQINVVIDNITYKIKELCLLLSPDILDDDIKGFWIQRKRMKIGNIKDIVPDHRIAKKTCGYVILDEDLEKEIEKSEGTTHYSFNFHRKAPNQIKQIVKTCLQEFQEQLGIRTVMDAGQTQRDMLNAMKDINEFQKKLGLISEFATGKSSKDVEISIESFKLPNNTKRINFGDSVGPIKYGIKNNTNQLQQIEIFLTAEQKVRDVKKNLFKKALDLQPNEEKIVECESFEFENGELISREAFIVVAKINNRNSGEQMCQVSRLLWFEMDEPETKEMPFKVSAYKPLFPRPNSNRVELTESIRNLRFKVSNHSACNVKINLDMVARKTPSASANVTILKEMRSEREFQLLALSDMEFAADSLDISGESFIAVNDGPANSEDRKCEIYFSVRLSNNMPELNMTKGQHLGKKSIEFYIGIDPPGRSVFKDVQSAFEPKDGRRSWHQGDRASGYVFILNEEHPSYKFAISHGDEVRQAYITEQMLCQAYAIAVSEQEFAGVSEQFKEILMNQEISPADAFLKIHEMIGQALIEMD